MEGDCTLHCIYTSLWLYLCQEALPGILMESGLKICEDADYWPLFTSVLLQWYALVWPVFAFALSFLGECDWNTREPGPGITSAGKYEKGQRPSTLSGQRGQQEIEAQGDISAAVPLMVSDGAQGIFLKKINFTE